MLLVLIPVAYKSLLDTTGLDRQEWTPKCRVFSMGLFENKNPFLPRDHYNLFKGYIKGELL